MWRRNHPPPTLPSMAQPEKTTDKPAPYSPTWTADPWVVVSKRMRNLEFPAVLLTRDANAEEMERWRRGPTDIAAARVPAFSVSLCAGVTILGALTTQWKYLDIPSQNLRPTNPPNTDACVLVWPVSTANEQVAQSLEFKARDADGRPNPEVIDPSRVADMWRRVLAYHAAQEDALIKSGVHLFSPLFVAQRGYDAPELTVGRLSDFLHQRGDAYREAFPYLAANYKGTRDGRHLGAFHDYCVRSDRGWDFVFKAREVLHMRPGLAR